jgi:putative Mg2+ transporter-C (MgtC) family protein
MGFGILTGVGFIGGGAILKRGDLVAGVTTAATLWMMTVIGLCLGGGQFGLGIAATLLGVFTLWALKWLDLRIPRDQHTTLVIQADLAAFSLSNLANLIAPLGYQALFSRHERSEDAQHDRLWFDIGWRRPEISDPPFDLPKLVNLHYPVLAFEVISEKHH